MKRFRLILLFLLASIAACAEHLFEVGMRAGMSGFNAQCYYVSPTPGFHGGMEVSYAYHSSHVIGFRVGATLDRIHAGFRKIDYTDSYSVMDVEGELMQVDYSIGRLEEQYATWMVGIPIQLALTKNHFHFYAGPKIVFPFTGSWNEKAENAALSVYYPQRDNRIYSSYPLAASRSFRESQEGAFQLLPKVQYWLAAEVGYDFLVYTGRRTKSYLSVGIYADYSFSPMSDVKSERISLLMLSDTREGFPLHRIMTPVVSAQRQGMRLVSSRKLFDFGIKFSYRIAPYNPHREANQACRCHEFFD